MYKRRFLISSEKIYSGICGDNCQYTLYNGILTISGTGPTYDYTLDSSIFKYLYSLVKKIIVLEGITSIGSYLFGGLSYTSDISLPLTLTSIKEGSFAYLGIRSIIIPKNVLSIGNYAFKGCINLNTIRFDNSTVRLQLGHGEYYTDWAADKGYYGLFKECVSLTDIYVGRNLIWNYTIPSIGWDSQFYNINITLSSNSTQFNSNFSRSSDINILSKEIVNISSLGNYAFYKCNFSENGINLLPGITKISMRSLSDTNITNLNLPDSVTTIESYAAANTLITSVVIPKNVTKLEGSSFSQCNNLTQILVDELNTNYDSRENCNAVILTSTNKLIHGCINTIIPNSVTCIEEFSFDFDFKSKEIVIPNSVTEIKKNAFYTAKNISRVICYATTPPTLTTTDVFSMSKLLPIYVPENALDAYKADSYWGYYTNIQSIESMNNITFTIDGVEY